MFRGEELGGDSQRSDISLSRVDQGSPSDRTRLQANPGLGLPAILLIYAGILTPSQAVSEWYSDLNRAHFLRNTRAERHKKSPAEILSGKPHPHWLEMLGFERLKRAA